jgi:hypothetical protein
VHLSAYCTCGEKLEEVGENKGTVISIHFDVENFITSERLSIPPEQN